MLAAAVTGGAALDAATLGAVFASTNRKAMMNARPPTRAELLMGPSRCIRRPNAIEWQSRHAAHRAKQCGAQRMAARSWRGESGGESGVG
jgi:hypothetical protein